MTDLRIVITNTSESNGTFLTPFWLGFHDSSFNFFDVGAPAQRGIEAIAEDGIASFAGAELLAADADGQGFVVAGALGPIAPGETTEQILAIDGASNPYLSLAAMLLPSNDAFVGNADPLRLFDEKGRFLGEQTLTFSGEDVLDAGTEVNTELDAAFINQTAPNTGIDEGGVIGAHPGFNGSLGNPIGEGAQIILGGTNAFGEMIDPVAADFTRPGAEIAEIHINTVVFREGTARRDVIIGGGDDDIVHAGRGNDVVLGRAGWDVIDGGDGNDVILGGRGNDQLFGGEGKDELFGGAGDDLIVGGTGNDWLIGGRGDDWFLFASGDGRDVIGDFGTGGEWRLGDDHLVIDVEGIESFDALLGVARQKRHDVVFDFGDGDRLTLENVSLSSLSASDVVFI